MAALVNVAAILTMLLWNPVNTENKPVFFVLAAMWGMSDAVWQTQINGEAVRLSPRDWQIAERTGIVCRHGMRAEDQKPVLRRILILL